MAKEWLSLGEVAEILGVHPSTVRNWADEGRLPVRRTSGGHRRFRRSEIDLWTQSERAAAPEEVNLVIQNALGYTRMKISAGRLESESWYQKLDDTAREAYRMSSRNLLQGLMKFLSAEPQAGKAEAHALGYEYATLGRRHALTTAEASTAFLFFRSALLDSLLDVFEAAAVNSPYAWGDMLRKINEFTDQVLLSLLETYQAFERGDQE